MDYEMRNLKDFLGLYNKVTELCFTSCVDNFFGRDLTGEEIRCSEACVGKFTNTNQKLLKVYMEVQGRINEKRMVEYEAQQAKIAEAQQKQQQEQQSQLAAELPPTSGDTLPANTAVVTGETVQLEAVAN